MPILVPSPAAAVPPGPCPLCSGRHASVVARRDRWGRPLTSVICEQCGLVRVDPLPAPQAVERFYAEDYRRRYKGAWEPRAKHCWRETQRAIARVEALLPLHRPGMRVLDVGAGAGFFPYAARRAGLLVDGIEPNRGYARFGRERLGLDCLRLGTLADVGDADYDLITIHHVFEHLRDPAGSMGLLWNATRPGGAVLIEVPNIEAGYHMPGRLFHVGHLYWYNPTTLAALARRCGFVVEASELTAVTEHVCMRLRRPLEGVATADWRAGLAGNAARVRQRLASRRALGHLLSPLPYARWWQRMARYAAERRAVGLQTDRAAIVVAACEAWLAQRMPAGSNAAAPVAVQPGR